MVSLDGKAGGHESGQCRLQGPGGRGGATSALRFLRGPGRGHPSVRGRRGAGPAPGSLATAFARVQMSGIRVEQQVRALNLGRIREALHTLPERFSPFFAKPDRRREWHRLATSWASPSRRASDFSRFVERPAQDDRSEWLATVCGCLSLRHCRMLKPAIRQGRRRGPATCGPRG